jgi:hypothetical protein
MLSMIGLIGGLALLMYLAMKGVNLLIAAPLTAFLVALLSGVAIFPQLAHEGSSDFLTSYMGGFSGFIASWFIMFLFGAIFGKRCLSCFWRIDSGCACDRDSAGGFTFHMVRVMVGAAETLL